MKIIEWFVNEWNRSGNPTSVKVAMMVITAASGVFIVKTLKAMLSNRDRIY